MVIPFNFNPGRVLARKYRVVSLLGAGWEGEVYKLVEIETGIERAGKFFYPERNPGNRTLRFYAKKLHKLRDCDILIHYSTQERITIRRNPISFLVSEYVEGVLLADFLKHQPGGRLGTFQSLHLLLALSKGLEKIHDQREYHGDLHAHNIIITAYGLNFSMKLVDLFHWKAATTENIQGDVFDMVRIFYDAVGGRRFYAKQPIEVKRIVCGLKQSLLKKKFRNAGQLRAHLEKLNFDSLMPR